MSYGSPKLFSAKLQIYMLPVISGPHEWNGLTYTEVGQYIHQHNRRCHVEKLWQARDEYYNY